MPNLILKYKSDLSLISNSKYVFELMSNLIHKEISDLSLKSID